MAIDYELALRIIRLEPDPALALRAFVDQERQLAAHEAKAEAWDEGHTASSAHQYFNPYRD